LDVVRRPCGGPDEEPPLLDLFIIVVSGEIYQESFKDPPWSRENASGRIKMTDDVGTEQRAKKAKTAVWILWRETFAQFGLSVVHHLSS